jgi:hypothetical protein
LHTHFRLFKRAPGTFTSSRLLPDGAWLDKVEHLGKAECLGEFDSSSAARDKAIELLAGDPEAIYLVCDAHLTIVHKVLDTATQEELQKRDERADVRAKLVITSIVAAIACFLLWRHGFIALTPGGIATILAVPVVLYFLTITFNPVETAVAFTMLLILLALSLAADAKLRKRASAAGSERPSPAAPQ